MTKNDKEPIIYAETKEDKYVQKALKKLGVDNPEEIGVNNPDGVQDAEIFEKMFKAFKGLPKEVIMPLIGKIPNYNELAKDYLSFMSSNYKEELTIYRDQQEMFREELNKELSDEMRYRVYDELAQIRKSVQDSKPSLPPWVVAGAGLFMTAILAAIAGSNNNKEDDD